MKVVARLDDKRKCVVPVRGMGRGQTFTAHAGRVKLGRVQDDALAEFPEQVSHLQPTVNSCSWLPWLCGMMVVAGGRDNCSNGGRQQTVSSASLAATLVRGKNAISTNLTSGALIWKTWQALFGVNGLERAPGVRQEYTNPDLKFFVWNFIENTGFWRWTRLTFHAVSNRSK
ncbi:hypothetical protein LP415_11165 [Polaromonas sp. P1(28)-8]|nr:hypothetical protein LP415_11165 [Polaromonas sp. P1(28)-8]